MMMEKLPGIDERPGKIGPDPPAQFAIKFIPVLVNFFHLCRRWFARQNGKIKLFDALIVTHAALLENRPGKIPGALINPV